MCLVDKSNYYLINIEIEQLFSYFQSDYNFDGWNMFENSVMTSLATKSYSFSGGKVVGLFIPTQSITYKFNNTN